MRKWFTKVATVIALACVGVVVTAVPAHASFGACSGNKFCVWLDTNGSGSMYYWGPEFANQCVYIGPPFHDLVSSAKNAYVDYKVTVYMDVNCSGTVLQYSTWQGYFGPGQYKSFSWPHNDAASSFKVQPA